MVTLKDVADACGISRSTVSKALNGYADVSKETTELVRQTAEAMGYLPNVAARSLKTNQTHNLGILMADEMGSGLKHEYFANVLNSFKEQAEERGYHITFLSRNLEGKRMTYLEQCRYRNFDGVLILCTDYEEPQVLELMKSSFPVVTVDYVVECCTAILSDNSGGIQELVQKILDKGHRKIAYIHGEMNSVTKKRVAGFYKICESNGIEVRKDWVLSARYRDPALCAKLTEELLTGEDQPTCILYPDDFALIGGLNQIRSMGMKIPDDISIAGFDGSFLAELTNPNIMTVKQNTEEIGRIAADKLVEAIQHPKTWLPEQVTVPCSLIGGESVRNMM
jgi:LacI family transcriptional regulator